MTSRWHIQYVTKHTDFGSKRKEKVNIFVLNSHNKLQIMLIKNKIFLWKRKTTAFWQKTGQKHGILAESWHSQHLTKITVFRDFRVSVIIYCP